MRLFVFLFVGTCLLRSQSPETKIFLDDGNAAMSASHWHQAEVAFEKAATADPKSVEAHTKLSNAIALQLQTGPATSPQNRPLVERALAEQQKAADLAPTDGNVLVQLARIEDAISRSTTDPDERTKNRNLALEHMRRALAIRSNDANYHYDLAGIQLFALGQAIGKAPRQPNGIRLTDDNLRRSLVIQFSSTIEEAIAHAERVVELQPDHGFAMLQACFGHVFRAALAESDTAAKPDVDQANQWQARFRKQFAQTWTPELQKNLIAGMFNPQVAIAQNPKMVPPPPPPPTPSLFDPGFSDRVHWSGAVAEANLIKKVEPVYPPLAKSAHVQGTVEFTATIDTTGHITNLQLVRGHPLLYKAAKEAVLQWEYLPTLRAGRPVEVITDIIVTFTLSQ